jgi:hypothetical protein
LGGRMRVGRKVGEDGIEREGEGGEGVDREPERSREREREREGEGEGLRERGRERVTYRIPRTFEARCARIDDIL